MHGFWEDCIAEIPSESIDGILFDTYPLDAEEIHTNHFSFFSEAFRVLKPEGILTYYSDEIDHFSDEHLQKLRDAGFSDIDCKICSVSPPANCEYWNSNTILAPIITKPTNRSLQQEEQHPQPDPYLRNRQTELYGLHLIMDCYGANPEKLGNVDFIFRFLDSLPSKIGMKKIGPPQMATFSDPSLAGVTGVVQIVTSHISIHTYQKKDCFFLDIFSCEDFDPTYIASYVQEIFDVQYTEMSVEKRGKHFPTTNLHG